MIGLIVFILLSSGAEGQNVNDTSGLCNKDTTCPTGYACRQLPTLPGTVACVYKGLNSMTTSAKRLGRCPSSWPFPPPVPATATKCNNHEDCNTNQRCCPTSFSQCATCVDMPQNFVNQQSVTQIIVGSENVASNPIDFVSSVTLINAVGNGGLRILVDSGIQRAPLLKSLYDKTGLVQQDIDIMVETHGHPDHYANVGLFPNINHIYNTFTYNGRTFNSNQLATAGAKYYLTSDNSVEVIATPGHTPQDISVIVRNVPNMGIVAVVGDLFQNTLALNDGGSFANDATKLQESQKNVICTIGANYVIPGHGAMLTVTPAIKTSFSC